MNKKAVLLIVLLCATLVCAVGTRLISAAADVYIRSDGSVEGTSSIIRDGETFTFTGDITGPLIVELDNIVINGAGYTLQTSSDTGVDLSNRNNVTVMNMTVSGGKYGIYLNDASNNIITGNNVTLSQYAIFLLQSPSNTITGNTLYSNGNGITAFDNNVVSENNVTENSGVGIMIFSDSNTVTGNIVANNSEGIAISGSNNLLRNNRMEGSIYNFEVQSGFVNDVDASNTVDSKPIIYWVNQNNKAVPLDAGYVALVNCTGITVENLTLTHNGEGVLLAFSTDSTITKNTITITRFGIAFYSASNNNVLGNNITNNEEGLYFDEATFQIPGYYPSLNNVIHHNDFILNQLHAVYDVAGTSAAPSAPLAVNIWDNGKEGNYWSGYPGSDSDGDGVGDTPYIINANNTDHYPLMEPFDIHAEIPEVTPPPSISILSPQNKTYNTTDIPLTFTVDKTGTLMTYSLDEQANVTITGNTTLNGLSTGSHSLTVYATDTEGNTGASRTIHFTVSQETEPESPAIQPWQIILIVAAVIIVVNVGLLVYFKKSKH